MTEDNQQEEQAMTKPVAGAIEWYEAKIDKLKELQRIRSMIHYKLTHLITCNFIMESGKRINTIRELSKHVADLKANAKKG